MAPKKQVVVQKPLPKVVKEDEKKDVDEEEEEEEEEEIEESAIEIENDIENNDEESDEDEEYEESEKDDEIDNEKDDDLDARSIKTDEKIDIEGCINDAYYDENVLIEPIRIPDDKRSSKAELFDYERTRVIAERVALLQDGAPALVKNVKNLNYESIAKLELLNNTLPFKLIRHMPNNTYEIWKLSELKH